MILKGSVMKNGSPKVKRAKVSMHRMKHQEAQMLDDMQAAFYRRVNPKRAQEIMDSRMIQEDNNAVANLSPRFINHEFNANRYMQSLGKYDESSEIGE